MHTTDPISKYDSFDSAGVRLHYAEAGEGPPVILMHGFSSSARKQWITTGVFAALARDFHVIAVDGRGHGDSGKPHDPAVYGPEMGQDLLRLQRHLGLGRAHFVGYSLGAMILARLVTRAPEHFLTCTLGGATGRFNWNEAKQEQLELEAAEMAEGSKRSQILRLWPAATPLPSDAEVAALSAQSLQGQDYKALAASRLGGGRLIVTPEEMAAVQVPTLGIVGTDDPYDEDFHALERIMPSLQVYRIAGANHSDATAHPAFVHALRAFLARHPAEQRD